jgi:hypothetical protein
MRRVTHGATLSGPLTFTDLARFNNLASGITAPSFVAIRDQATWQAMWTSLGSSAALPSVDFTRNMVIVASNGTQLTLGYSLVIQAVSVAQSVITLSVLETKPGLNCVVGDALTVQFDVIQAPATSGSVVGQVTVQTFNCG